MDKSTSPPEHIAIKLDAMLPRVMINDPIFSSFLFVLFFFNLDCG